ncbi:hypothetical protein QTO34_019938 [Cnephaeus nilssonii]|uniref:Uncharacterized protein n=1 Tax=Cnephaeus nilssonii TaxID=3371016 RepID=A0AA40HXM1_CNENI|nr:hypothetical protein QTO34_019938 [Eptesicus nilssonii]
MANDSEVTEAQRGYDEPKIPELEKAPSSSLGAPIQCPPQSSKRPLEAPVLEFKSNNSILAFVMSGMSAAGHVLVLWAIKRNEHPGAERNPKVWRRQDAVSPQGRGVADVSHAMDHPFSTPSKDGEGACYTSLISDICYPPQEDSTYFTGILQKENGHVTTSESPEELSTPGPSLPDVPGTEPHGLLVLILE